MAEKYDITLGQLALAWVISQPNTRAIVGARNSNQAIQNAKAMQITLFEDDLNDLDNIGKSVTDHIDDNPVMWDWS
jgi:myo-inositol catabolism protein IolS